MVVDGPGGALGSQRGSWTANSQPPSGTLRREIVPRWCSATRLAMARLSPVPADGLNGTGTWKNSVEAGCTSLRSLALRFQRHGEADRRHGNSSSNVAILPVLAGRGRFDVEP